MITRNAPEFAMQCALFEWARLVVVLYPALRLLRGSLNGVHLSKAQAGKAKQAGMLKGEHDVTLLVPRCGYTGLSIELKHGDNMPTEAQLEYGALLEEEGWLVCYCWSWDTAAKLLVNYLEEKVKRA